MSDRVTIDVTGGIADVRLNRPDKLNALDNEMFVRLVKASESLKARPDVRAVVFSGAGRSFCAGLDFSSFQAMAAGSDNDPDNDDDVASVLGSRDGRITHLAQQAVWGWQELDVPVICAISGHALGGGFQLVLGADIRIVHPETKMSVLEIQWGLIPDMCASVLLPRLVGADVAAELYFTGKMISGTEAVNLGVCTRASDDPRAAAMELAANIAGMSPKAIRHAKTLVHQHGRVSPAEAFAKERECIGELIGSPDQVEAVTAYFEKREPQFADVG